MKYSYNWIQKHINEKLPEPSKIEEVLIAKAFEVEEVVNIGEDTIFDIKVLPDRSHDALSHLGMAREIASLLSLDLKEKVYETKSDDSIVVSVQVEENAPSNRFSCVKVNNISVEESPRWLKESLENIGQRSINTIVDVTNYVLFDIGKPLHVFDADKVKGSLNVRFAKDGEEMETLDGKKLKLSSNMLVIADETAVLSLAGIKGGVKAEVDKNTKNIIIESAVFGGANIRKTSQQVGIKTDAAKRFENGITAETCVDSLNQAVDLISSFPENASCVAGVITDVYKKPEKRYKIGVSASEVNVLLGSSLDLSKIKNILDKRYLDTKIIENPREELVSLAKSYVGRPYKRGASVLYDSPNSFDCSSLTASLCTEIGTQIPRVAVDQYVFGYEISKEDILPGDFIFSNTGVVTDKSEVFYSKVLEKEVSDSPVRCETLEWMPGTKVDGGIDHVGVYVGDGFVVHATSTKGQVVMEKVEDSILSPNTSYRRILKNNEPRIVASVPYERMDIRIKEDLIDEVSKEIGTDQLSPTIDFSNIENKGMVYDGYHISSLIRKKLKELGFLEIMTTSFSGEGDISILESVDPKKNHVRPNLSENMKKAIQKSFFDAPLLERETVQLFEIGKVFKDNGEFLNIALGATSRNKKLKKNIANTLNDVVNILKEEKVIFEDMSITDEKFLDGTIFEAKISLPGGRYELLKLPETTFSRFSTISQFPFIVRDISVFLSKENEIDDVLQIIEENKTQLCVKNYIFDKFQKDGEERVSLGVRLVFQSNSRTLTEEEIEPTTQIIYSKLSEKGFEIR